MRKSGMSLRREDSIHGNTWGRSRSEGFRESHINDGVLQLRRCLRENGEVYVHRSCVQGRITMLHQPRSSSFVRNYFRCIDRVTAPKVLFPDGRRAVPRGWRASTLSVREQGKPIRRSSASSYAQISDGCASFCGARFTNSFFPGCCQGPNYWDLKSQGDISQNHGTVWNVECGIVDGTIWRTPRWYSITKE